MSLIYEMSLLFVWVPVYFMYRCTFNKYPSIISPYSNIFFWWLIFIDSFLDKGVDLHNVEPLTKISSELRKSLREKLENLSEPIAAVNKILDEAKKDLRQFQKEGKDMISKIDQIAKEKVWISLLCSWHTHSIWKHN